MRQAELQRSRDEHECKDIEWQCGACNKRLAFVDAATKMVVRIKFKELYLEIDFAQQKVTEMCTFCAAKNEINMEPPAAADGAAVKE